MEFENLLTLIKTVSESELTSFTMKDGDLKISMGKEKQVVVEQTGIQVMPAVAGNADTVSAGSGSFNGKQEQQEECQPEGKIVKAPLVGTFYAASAPDAEAFVNVGDTVKKGQTLGIIEAMKLMNEIESEYDGVVKEILIENGQMAEYGQPLFVIG
ncbi:MAG: acetyl-CoA carboxylase biotin carboxyl carrier protein [Blautia sp.]|nr:acetyl-CoA carboxylase biotin carboxyl carrier protein [Blautia sp.]